MGRKKTQWTETDKNGETAVETAPIVEGPYIDPPLVESDTMMAARMARKDRDPNAPRTTYIVIGSRHVSGERVVIQECKSLRGASKWAQGNAAMIAMACSSVTIYRARAVVAK